MNPNPHPVEWLTIRDHAACNITHRDKLQLLNLVVVAVSIVVDIFAYENDAVLTTLQLLSFMRRISLLDFNRVWRFARIFHALGMTVLAIEHRHDHDHQPGKGAQ